MASNDSTDYSQGKIYAIRSVNTPLIYIGSTTKELNARFSNHLSDYKLKPDIATTSKEILLHGNCWIELLRDYPCANRSELEQEEQRFINLFKDRCVNKHNAYNELHRTNPPGYQKQYQQDHKDEISEKKKEKFICECGGQYTSANKAQHSRSDKHKKFVLSKQIQTLTINITNLSITNN